MASYSAFRLFFRLEKPGRLPTFCTTPFLERQYLALQARSEDAKRAGMMNVTCTASRFKIPIFRRYSTAVSTSDVVKSDAERLLPKKRGKTAESPKIMLISETKHISVVTLEEGQKIAERNHLHLVPADSHESKDGHLSDKPVYKLITNVEFASPSSSETSDLDTAKDFKVEKDDKKKEKELKTVILKSKIAENDVVSKVKQMSKWIEKGHSIRVMIGQVGEKGDASHVYKLIEENMKECGARFVQKVSKGANIRVQIMPPKQGVQPVVTKHKQIENISST